MAGLTQEPISVSATLAPTDNTTTYGLRRTDFMVKGGTGLELNSNGKEAKKPSFEAEFVQITEQTRQEYSTFLTNHLNGLIRLRNQKSENDPKKSKFDELVKEVPTHAYEAQLLDQIMGSDGKIDQKKLSDFLSTSKGYIFTTQLIEEMTSAKLFMLGLKGIKEPAGGREQIVDELRVKLGVDQGAVNKLLSKMPAGFQAFVSSQLIAGGVAAAGEAIVRMLGNDRKLSFNDTNYSVPNESFLAVAAAPAAVAATLATVVGGGRLIGRSLKDGVTLDLKRSLSGLRMLQGNPKEAAYLKAMTGVDVNDYDTTDDTLSFRSGRISESTTDPNQLRLEILQGTYARQHFLEDIGVDPKKTDATPNQWLFGKLRRKQGESASLQDLQPEQLGTTWDQMVVEKFKPNDGGVRDKMGRHVGDEFFGTSRDIKIQFEYNPGIWVDITREDPRYKANLPRIRTFQRRILYADPAIQVLGNRSKFREWKPGDPDPDLIPSCIFIEMGEDISDSVTPSQIEYADPAIFVSWISKNHIRNSAGEYFMKGITGQNLQYNPEVLDTEGNLRRYADAKRAVMGELLNEFVADEVKREAEAQLKKDEETTERGFNAARSILDQRIGGIDGQKSQELAKIDDRKAALEAERVELSAPATDTVFTRYYERRKTVQSTERILQNKHGLVPSAKEDYSQAATRVVGDISSQLDKPASAGATPAIPLGPRARLQYYQEQVAIEQNTKLKNLQKNKSYHGALTILRSAVGQAAKTAAIQEIERMEKTAIESVNNLYRPLISQAQKETDALVQKITEIEATTEQWENQELELRESEEEVRNSDLVDIPQMKKSFAEFTTVATATIDAKKLLEEPISDLIVLAKAAPYNLGTSKSDEEILEMVLEARTEAQILTEEDAYDEFNSRLSPSIADWKVKTVDDLLATLTSSPYSWSTSTPKENRIRVENALRRAKYQDADPDGKARRYEYSRKTKLEYIDRELEKLKLERASTAKRFDDQKKELESWRDALPQVQQASDAQGSIFTRVRDEMVENTDFYLGTTAIVSTDTHYTPSEQSAAYPEGYYRMLNLIFDYQDKPDRDKIYAQVSAVLPPERLAKHLNDSLGLGLMSTADFKAVATEIKKRKNLLGPQDYRRAIRDFINNLRLEALAKT